MPGKENRPVSPRPADRRNYAREKVSMPLFFQVISNRDPAVRSSMREGRLKDLSAGGLCFYTDAIKVDGLHLSYDELPLQKNRLLIKIPFPPPYGTLEFVASVVWFERPLGELRSYAVGVEFIQFKDQAREALQRYLKEVR